MCEGLHLKLVKKHEEKQVEMATKGDVIFQEIFSMTDPMVSIKLLPSCSSLAVPFCHIHKMLTTAMQWGEDLATTTAASNSEVSLVPVFTSSPVHPGGTPPPLIPLLLDFPLNGTPLVVHPFPGFTISPSQRKQDHCPSDSISNHHNKWTHVHS